MCTIKIAPSVGSVCSPDPTFHIVDFAIACKERCYPSPPPLSPPVSEYGTSLFRGESKRLKFLKSIFNNPLIPPLIRGIWVAASLRYKTFSFVHICANSRLIIWRRRFQGWLPPILEWYIPWP